MKIEEYKDEKQEHRIRLTADNGNIIYASTEGYKNLKDAKQAAIKSALDILDGYYKELTLDNMVQLEDVLEKSANKYWYP